MEEVVILLGSHNHEHLLQVVLLELNFQLVSEVRHQLHLHHLAGVLAAHVFSSSLQNFVQMVLDAETGRVLTEYALDMQCARLEGLLILVTTHVNVENLIGNLGISPSLLHNLNGQQRIDQGDRNGSPHLHRAQL